MNTQNGDFIIEGFHGTEEDILFDELVGAIEDFMVSLNFEDTFKLLLPPLSSVPSDHERYNLYKSAIQKIESALDAHVLKKCPSFKSINEVSELLARRKDEITEDVWDFIEEGFLAYPALLEKWALLRP